MTSSFYLTFPSCVRCIFEKKKKCSVNQGCAHTVEGAALGPVDGLSSSGGGEEMEWLSEGMKKPG